MTRSSLFGAAALVAAIGATLSFAQFPSAQAQASAEATFTDAQVQAFVAASAEIDPISRRLTNATPAQHTEGAAQIRVILQRRNLDASIYNAIATRAQTDTALQGRIDAARGSAAATDTAPQH